MVLVLNHQRQIVAANDAALQTLQTTVPDLIGKRPGEAVACIRAHEGPGAADLAALHDLCAVQAILGSQQQNCPVTRECRILTEAPRGSCRST